MPRTTTTTARPVTHEDLADHVAVLQEIVEQLKGEVVSLRYEVAKLRARGSWDTWDAEERDRELALWDH